MRPILFLLILAVAACNRDGAGSRVSLDPVAVTPDEFMVTTTRDLRIPDDLATLPVPLPGGGNLADRDPDAELTAALGGAPRLAGGIPAADAALVAAVSRMGVTPDIRAILAAEDQAMRAARQGRIRRLADDNQAGRFYAPMLLDPHAELARLRAAGVTVPNAPPQ